MSERLQTCQCNKSTTDSSFSNHSKLLDKNRKPLVSRPPLIQTKLTINQPGDEYEQEADRVAEQVMRMPDPASVPQSPVNSRPERLSIQSIIHYPERDIQRKEDDDEEEEGIVQMKQVSSSHSTGSQQEVPPSVHEVLSSPGLPLDPATRAYMEPRFGHDFSRVKVHFGPVAEQSAREVNANAYTVENEIVFGAGQYEPATVAGSKLLAHELTHVVQQSHTQGTPLLAAHRLLRQKKGDKGQKTNVVDLATANKVMYSIINIINEQERSEPDKWVFKESWYLKYKDLLTRWYIITYGEKTNGSRTKLKGDLLRQRIDEAMAATQPVLDVLKSKGGRQWKENLRLLFYPKVVEFEFKSFEARPAKKKPGTPANISFDVIPEPVSVEEFLSVAALQNSQPIEIQRGIGGYYLETANTGDAYQIGRETRTLLWGSYSNHAVFYEAGGQIYKQLNYEAGGGFAPDVLLGTFITAAQNAAGSVFLATLMLEIAISVTPFGTLWDAVMAFEKLTKGDYAEAALIMLPGPSLHLAKKTKAGRTALRAAGIAAKAPFKLVGGAVKYIGKGAYRIGGKLRRGHLVGGKLSRGIWVVSEEASAAGGKRSYAFYDEVADEWHKVEDASTYIKCTACDLTPSGKGLSKEAALEELIEEIPNAYKSKQGLLLDKKLLKEVMDAYGDWGGHVVDQILDTWLSTKHAIKLAEDTLIVAKELSKLKGRAGVGLTNLVDIFDDLASLSTSTAQGTIFELRYAAAHVDDIDGLALPTMTSPQKWLKGLDMSKKGGEMVELKNYDFTKQFYTDNPDRAVSRILKQVKSRAEFAGTKKVTVVFSSEAGKMPDEFRKLLESELAILESSSSKGIKLIF